MNIIINKFSINNLMIEQDKYILVIVFSIILFYFIWRFGLKKSNRNLSNGCKIKEGFNSLYNYSKLVLKEDHGIGMFGGNDEVFVYEIEIEPIAGIAGARAKPPKNVHVPKLGFKPNEVKKITNFEKAVVKKDGIEYVDNNLMVPLLYHITKRLTIMVEDLQSQISDCCYK